MNKQIPASELPLQADGAIYHLNLHPEELADNPHVRDVYLGHNFEFKRKVFD